MKDLRTFLLSRKGWQDEKGNTVVFSDRGLYEEPQGEEFWIFLDEGLRCGGMNRKIKATEAAVREALLGCRKTELWSMIEKDIAEHEERE